MVEHVHHHAVEHGTNKYVRNYVNKINRIERRGANFNAECMGFITTFRRSTWVPISPRCATGKTDAALEQCERVDHLLERVSGQLICKALTHAEEEEAR